jgi:hypothetical protein
MKTCRDCKVEKEFTEFRKRKSSKDGFRNQCKKCLSIKSRKWRKENQYKILENRKKDYEKNKERYKRKAKEWVENNKERVRKRAKDYYKKNELRIKEWNRQYQIDSKDKVLEYRKVYYETNKNIICKKTREYYNKNKVKVKIYSKEYAKERKKTDTLFKMKCNLRTRTWSAFKRKGYKKTSQTQDMLGVDWEVCKAHIERQFKKGMKWRNHGEWHIDHIIPLASAKNEKELRKLCYYRNLQPLWAVDNLNKSDKIIGQQSFMRI